MPASWSAPAAPPSAQAVHADAWERALRALAACMLRLAARHAQRRQQRARRQRVLQARRVRHAQRLAERAVRRELARQVSPRLRRDLGL